MTHPEKKFTLLELLVVIGIISILLAMLLPALQKARQSAKGILCLSNHKQIASAILMYANDNSDMVPVGILPPQSLSNSWFVVCESYYGNSKVLLCPSAPSDINPWFTIRSSMGYNAYYLNLKNLGQNYASVRVTKVRNPTQTVLMSDGGWSPYYCVFRTEVNHYPPSLLDSWSIYLTRPYPWHFGACGTSWIDGHAELMRMGGPFHPAFPWVGNGVTDPLSAEYKDELWDLE